jgi:ATP-dependent NAD(P)H-hydrate dehydratase
MIIRNIKFTKNSNSIHNIIITLNNSSHKGQSGRICVIGGSQEYSGAPYYSAISSLKFGGDLAFVYCSSEALIPIKCYSPELIVNSFYDMNELNDLSSNENNNIEKIIEISTRVTCNFSKYHAIIIGPGLGRNLSLFKIIEQIIIKAKNDQIPMIIDADGLFLISMNLNLIYACKTCILTPNYVEFSRLVNSAIESIQSNNNIINNNEICQQDILEKLIQKDITIQLNALCSYFGLYFLYIF